jgi:hypothetical protein
MIRSMMYTPNLRIQHLAYCEKEGPSFECWVGTRKEVASGHMSIRDFYQSRSLILRSFITPSDKLSTTALPGAFLLRALFVYSQFSATISQRPKVAIYGLFNAEEMDNGWIAVSLNFS